MSRCVICGELIVGYGHNAVPVRDGRCCDICNDFRVIPARLRTVFRVRVDGGKTFPPNEEVSND